MLKRRRETEKEGIDRVSRREVAREVSMESALEALDDASKHL